MSTNENDFPKEEKEKKEEKKSSMKDSLKNNTKRKKPNPPTRKENIKLFALLVIYILLNLFGGFIFTLLEKNTREGKVNRTLYDLKQKFAESHNSCLTYSEMEKFLLDVESIVNNEPVRITGNNFTYPEVWSLNNGFILAFTIASTIGYGTITPVTPGGQIFAILYALLTIPFTAILAARIGYVIAYLVKKATTRLLGFVQKAKVTGIIFTFMFGIIIYVFLPSIFLTFVGNDEEWSFINSLYCVIITLTTVGFGDFVPDPHEQGGLLTSIFVLIWVIAGLGWFATLVQLLASHMSRQASTLRRKVKVTSPLLKTRFIYNNKVRSRSETCREIPGHDNCATLLQVSSLSDEKIHCNEVLQEIVTHNIECQSQHIVEDNETAAGPGCFHAVMANIKNNDKS